VDDMVRLRMVIDCFMEAWEFLKTSGQAAFIKLLKITTLSYLVAVLFILTALIPFFVLDGRTDISTIIIPLLFSIGVIFLGIFFSSVVSSISLNVIDGMFQKREASIKTKFMGNLIPMLKWSVFRVALFSPYIVLYYWFFTSAASSIDYEFSSLLFTLVKRSIDLVSVVIGFFIMFGIYELIIARQGLFPSLLRSINLVKNNFIETVAFVIIKGIINSLLVIPLIILFLLYVFLLIASASSIPNAALLIAAVGVLLLFVSLIFFSALSATIFIPLEYIYWKKIREKNTN